MGLLRWDGKLPSASAQRTLRQLLLFEEWGYGGGVGFLSLVNPLSSFTSLKMILLE